MQRVANCIYVKDGNVLLLQKPRRNWWAIPGGKMEPTETVKQAVLREYWEETGIRIKDPQLKGIYTFLMKNDEGKIREWMMFNFYTNTGVGIQKEVTDEGILKWHSIKEIQHLPMAEGDRLIIQHAIEGNDVAFGAFEYTEDFQLLSYQINK
ncbi:8-oxo-dGTP diphosphatase [Caldibacillus thermolactis]|jgi:8-oxo-dGTP diphosphatase|uniref:8-oxo-dGTP diphosphatase n=1 Tax=Pallidibacillus thermolactis TaxID=251051 RepID=A0ABT2WC05_9BACI|nr:8-oxo-dGTP diphosphatase [Pallidibacillus thermolactis]MCU9593212.1 8-oxo-dGTP diphosphatase [Pallidibacillus thermolactis]MCU9599951.1 8-oxo-dGTP diphosphatase [Pallidibacillus thermolactis subsp. kokeshiiformis]